MKISRNKLMEMIHKSINKSLTEGFKTVKPYSQEWQDTFGDPEYEDFEDWEKNADKYNTYYQYDKDLPTRLDLDNKNEYDSIPYRKTQTRKAFDDYANGRNNREPLKSRDSELAWSQIERNRPQNAWHGRYWEENPNIDSDSSKYFRKRFINGELDDIIKESVKKVLNEIESTPGMGWMGLKFEDDDWTPVNEPTPGDVCYKIKVWTGSGYTLSAFKAYAQPEDYESALEALVAYLDKQGNNKYFTDNWTNNEIENLRAQGVSDEEIEREIEKWGDYYVDAKRLGASQPHWLRGENLQIQQFPIENEV